MVPGNFCVCSVSQLRTTLFDPWSIAYQAPLAMGFSRQKYWRGCHFLLWGIFPNPRIKPAFPVSPALTGGFFTTVPPGKPEKFLRLGREGNTASTLLAEKLIIWALSHIGSRTSRQSPCYKEAIPPREAVCRHSGLQSSSPSQGTRHDWMTIWWFQPQAVERPISFQLYRLRPQTPWNGDKLSSTVANQILDVQTHEH